MICRNCGNFNEDTNTICAVCGASLVEEAPVEAVAEEVVAEPFADTIPQEAAEAPVEDPGKTLGLVAMILGILSLVAACCLAVLGIPFAIGAIVCGFIAMNKSKAVGVKNTFAIIGLALGGVGIVATIASSIIGAITGAAAGAMLSGY